MSTTNRTEAAPTDGTTAASVSAPDERADIRITAGDVRAFNAACERSPELRAALARYVDSSARLAAAAEGTEEPDHVR